MIIVSSKPRPRRRRTEPFRDPLPFGRLEALDGADALPDSAQRGMDEFRRAVGDDASAFAQCLVRFSVQVSRRRGHRGGLSISILNRRRRAATLRIQEILAGRVSEAARRTVAHALVPQLAGTGPDLELCAAFGRDCIEYFRGLVSARIMAESADNLLPQAKALHALDTVLAIHLGAIERAAGEAADFSPGATKVGLPAVGADSMVPRPAYR